MTKIVQLSAENVKRIRAVHIRPDGHLVVIGGKNGAGKSSVLDSIAYALGGKAAAPSEPVRKGEEAAKVVIELDDLVVKRTITASGSYLSVETKEGAKYPSPQAILDRLTGALSFDPLAFTRLQPAAQAEALRKLTGLDFSELERQRAVEYENRRLANRKAKELQARVDGIPAHPDVPEELISVTALADELDVARRHNRLHEQFKDLEGEEQAVLEKLRDIRKAKSMLEAGGAAEPTDEEPIRERIRTAEETNHKVRENAARVALIEEVLAAEKEAERADDILKGIAERKAEAIQEAAFPIEGLSFDGEAVTYNGIPFDQASQAEQIRVSVAVGLAMNPELRVLLVRDGSLLDEDNLGMIAEMAAAADAQVWIERVGDGEEVSVVIEDGAVRGAPEPEAVAAE